MANRIPTAALVRFCQMVRVGLDAGLPILRVFEQQSQRGPGAIRPLAWRISQQISKGDTLTEALEAEGNAFPPLFHSLVQVGEITGKLADSFRELEDYYELQLTLQRNFRAQIRYPIFQLVVAVFVVCLMLWIMGAVGAAIDPLGLGVGGFAAFKFFLIIAAGVGTIYLIYRGIANQLRFLAPVERLILRMPLVGPALQAVLLSRFTAGLRFTLGAGLSVPEAVRHSLDASASALYKQSYQKAEPGLKRGDELTEVLTRCEVFPSDFLDIVANAEESGQVPEVMTRVSRSYQEDAERKLKMLAQAAGWLVFVAVAVMIIVLIFKIFGSYVNQINRFT